MRFEVLGPLRVAIDDTTAAASVSQVRLRVLLAALLWRGNRSVPVEELADLVWDGAAPVGAAGTTRAYVMRLRRLLGDRDGTRIVTRAPGYQLEVLDGELDAWRFEALCQRAGVAVRAGAWDEAQEDTTRALELWRGTPLADVASRTLREAWVPRLEQLRTQALEWRVDAALHLGDGGVVSELYDLTRNHPLHERFHAQLMLALLADGRRADALAAYRHARTVLVDQLGIEPGPELRQIQERILRGDTTVIREPVRASGGAAHVPRQLPAAVRHFVGRITELKTLTGLLGQENGPAGTVVISAIDGTAGIGKTALAVHWAHEHADRFPGGQLYVNLRGFGPGEPVDTATAVGGFLSALGVPVEAVPADLDARLALYRSQTAGRRMLVVLDNAGDSEQARALLPGGTGCCVLVTSRAQLGGLVARDGAVPLTLDVLRRDEAVELFGRRLGRERVDREERDVRELAELCARLPVALNIAAARATLRPDVPLRTLVDELSDRQRRLDGLATGDDAGTAVRSVFAWSYQRLSAAAARAFGLIGLHPGLDFEPYAVAALLGTGRAGGVAAVDELARAHLVQPTTAGRHGMHDLLRVYARECSADLDAGTRDAALARLSRYYLGTAAAAVAVVLPGAAQPAAPGPDPTDAPAPDAPVLTGEAEARAWLDAECANLVAMAGNAGPERLRDPVELSMTLFRYLDYAGRVTEAAAIHGYAVRAATALDDRPALGHALVNLGGTDLRQARHRPAADRFHEALTIFRAARDLTGELRALGCLAVLDQRESRYDRAVLHFGQVLELTRRVGAPLQEIRALTSLGQIDLLRGRYRAAAGHFAQADERCDQTGDQTCRPDVLIGLAEVEMKLGAFGSAAGHLEQASGLCQATGNRSSDTYARYYLGILELHLGHHDRAGSLLREACTAFHDSGDQVDEAHALTYLAELDRRLGRYGSAGRQLDEALRLCRETGDRAGEVHARTVLGRVHLAAGDPARAVGELREAVSLAGRITTTEYQAHAHDALGDAFAALGQPTEARRNWHRAHELYAELDLPDADRARRKLG